MRKKFTMLLASLFLTLGTAWALPTEGQLYRIKNVVTTYYLDITSTQTNGIKNCTLDVLDVNQCFYFLPKEGSVYYIKSANNQYVATDNNHAWNMRATDVMPTNNSAEITLVSVADAVNQYYLQTNNTADWGHYIAPNNGENQESAVMYSDKAEGANYPKWEIIAVTEAELTELITAAKDELASVITEAENVAANACLSASDAAEKATLSTAITTAEGLGDDAKIEDITAAKAALQSAVNAAQLYIQLNDITYVTALGAENSNHPLVVSTKRSDWGVGNNATSMSTISKLGLAALATDAKQQFAIITPDNGANHYIYSIKAKRFLKKDNTFGAQGDAIQLNDASANGENRVQFQFKGTSLYINVDNSNPRRLLIDGWDDVDDGNACEVRMHNALTFDLTEALDVFNNHAVINVTYKLGDKKATTSEYKSKGETYSFSNPYGFTSVVSCTNNGEALAANDGVYSFEITGDANVVVEIQENLPFTTTTITDGDFAAGTEWYAITQKDNASYWQYQNGQDPNVKHIATNDIYDETQMWCFTGNSLDGFKIYNKKAGATYSLKTDLTVKLVENNSTVWNVKPSTEAFTESDKRLGFSRPGKSGNDEFINRRDGGTLQNWSLDAGSTSRLVSIREKYAEIAANWEKKIMAGAVGSIIGDKAEQMRTLIDAYVAAPSQANEDAVTELLANVADADRLQLKEGSYYMVVSADGRFLANQSVEKAIYSDGTDLRWGTRDNLNRAQIWKAVKVDSKWRFQNFKDMLVMVASKTNADDVFVQRQDDVTSDYTADIKLENIQNTFTQWNVKFESAPDASMHAIGHSSGNGGTSNIILYGGGNASDPSAWRIMEMSQGEVVSAAKAELNALMTTLKNDYYDSWAGTDYKWRDQPGVNNYTLDEFYSSVGNLEAYYNAAKAVYDNEQSTVDNVENQISLLSAVLTGLAINLPEAGKFYRLRCVGGQKYVSADISSSRFEMQSSSSKDPDHMFLYDGNALLSFSQGLYMNHQNFNAVAAKSTVVFTEAANGAKGQYNIKIGERYIYGRGNTQNNHIDSGTGSPTDANEQGYNWWLEEVTSLPVVIGEVGYATFYTPVAVEIPEGENFTASIISEINGDEVVLQEVEGVVPAGTGLILEAGQGTYNFNIATGEVPAIEKGHLKGTMAKSIITAENNTNYYVLANTNGKVGLYKAKVNRDEDGNKVDEGGVAFLNNANRVYLPVATSQGAMAPAMFRFRGKGQGTTEIEVPATNDLQPAVIYDLTGRRIEKIVEKGIYIVNGKKVVIK